jgi:hypothetical protein
VVSALDDQSSETANAAREGKLFADAMKQGADSTDALRQSAQELHDTLVGMVDKELGYRNAIDATEEAQKAAADAMKEHKAGSEEHSDAVRALEGAMLGQANAARELAISNSTATTEAGKAEEGTRAFNKEVVALAVAAGTNAPRSLQLLLAGMNNAELAAAGATRTIDGAGNAVIRLPNGKDIRITAQDNATALITSVANRNYRAVVYVDAVFRQTPSGAVLNSRSAWGNASGGPVRPAVSGGARGGMTMVNEQGPELKRTQRGALIDAIGGETIVPAGQSAAIAAAAGGGQGGGGFGGGPITINLMVDRRVFGTATVESLRAGARAQAGGDIVRYLKGRS